MHEQISTRRLRVVKYRGSAHGTNEYPFLIGERGISVLPITSMRLDHQVSAKRIPTGIARLDEMLGGKGVYRGSSVLVSGSPGTGKSSIGAQVCRRRVPARRAHALFAYEESPAQIMRNMRSIGIDLEPWVKKGLLQIHSLAPDDARAGAASGDDARHGEAASARASSWSIRSAISRSTAATSEVKPTLMRLIDFLKQQQITALFTSLTAGGTATTRRRTRSSASPR